MDVGGSGGGRLVLALEAEGGDLVADDLLLSVDADLEDALGALQATSLLALGVDNLVRGGDDAVGGGEEGGLAAAEAELEVKVEVEVEIEVDEVAEEALAVVVLAAEVEDGGGLGSGREGDGGDGGGLHLERGDVVV